MRVGGAWTTFRNQHFKIWRTAVADAPDAEATPAAVPGSISGVSVATGDRRIDLLEVQAQGRTRQVAFAWLNGARLSPRRSICLNPMTADVRRIAIDAVVRIESDGAYANVLLPKMLAEVDLEARDKGFVTELVYGSTRRKRALDHVVDRFLVQGSATGQRVPRFGWAPIN